ncbi:NADPH:quinone reductase-like Zn-dependent oxidoreductase [Haloferula luteola]|uniref:enoyl-[acyl-carrier-protein] reductase n=1 Tax=Haloferula luteola TaxID=595692 RepID=A0A840VJZ4_9BACT|nr:2-enoyl thioester reductase domain-containing protein [Haloferula luteola]MBB5353001.1 NADPH:quinone reductase-like Zn-dependent oxidoreductase [Haloferula luteola]
MKLSFSACGVPADVLGLTEDPPASLPDGFVRLKVLASPINPADLNFIEGTYGVKPELPATPGIEGCAEVTESLHEGFSPGDRVIVLSRGAMWARETIFPGDVLFKLPEGIDPLQASMLKVNPATAFRMLHGFVAPPPGGWVVQNAANSGVGRCVIQICKVLGWRTLNLVRRPELMTELKNLGADEVLLDEGDAVDAAKALLGDDRPVLALNAVGGDSALRLMNLLAEGGSHVTYGAMGRKPLKVPNGLLIFKDISLHGFWMTKWLENARLPEVHRTYGLLAQLMADGKLDVPIDSTHPLGDFSAALERLEAPDRQGKVLFQP